MEATFDLVFSWVTRMGGLVLVGFVFWIALRPEPKKHDPRGFEVKPPDDSKR